MAGLVTSRSILDITRQAADMPPSGPPPDVSQVSRKSSDKASLVVAFQTAQAKHKQAPAHFSITQAKIAAANTALNDIPEGFELAPLVYTRISQDQNREVYKEFTKVVKPRFMKFLARHHADDLRAMGICAAGIKRMSRGMDPADKDGRLYDVSVDHIIERSGGGKLSVSKSLDPKLQDMLEEGECIQTYNVNHFTNLMLMPNDVHFKRKNAINEIQQLPNTTREGESVYAVMMVPTRNGQGGTYAFRPPKDRIADFGAKGRKMTGDTRINHCFYLLDLLDEALGNFYNDPSMRKTTGLMEQMASQQKIRLSDALIQAKNDKDSPLNAIRLVFDAAFSLSERRTKYEFKRILSLTNEIGLNISAVVDELKRSNPRSRFFEQNLSKLEKFCDSQAFNTILMRKLSKLPALQDGAVSQIILKHRADYLQQKARLESVRPQNDNDTIQPKTATFKP